MMLKRLLVGVLSLIVFPLLVSAQERIVTGKVTDSKDGSPVVGATVLPKGSTTGGTTTSATGDFTIRLGQNVKALIISYVGFATQEVAVTGNTVSVSLVGGGNNLNEVVVIGYGTQRKKDLTGSIATVTTKDFQQGAINTPEQLIAGKVPGVSVISNSGQPGSGSTIRIRGGASLNASNDPLIVIDGVPLDNTGIPGSSNALSFINPNDIESFSILKDASAAAIYGTRASNGVIIITTKKGRGGPLKVNFSTVNSLSTVIKEVSVLTADQFRAVVNANGSATQKAKLGLTSTDWQKQIYRPAFATDNVISLTGGIPKLPYRLSLGYNNSDGILKTDNLQRFSVGLGVSPIVWDNHLKIDANINASMENTRFGNQGAIGGAVTFDPTQSVHTNNPKYDGYFEWPDPNNPSQPDPLAGKNPVAQLNQRVDKAKPQRFIGSLALDYKFHWLPDLHANLSVAYDYAQGKGTVFVPDSNHSALAFLRNGQNTQYSQTKKNSTLEFYLNYVKEIKSIRSRIDVLAGYSYYDYLTHVDNFADYDVNGNLIGATPPYAFDEPEHTLLSFFGRANFTFEDRYLLTGTIRRDGSSRFGPANKYGVFPSLAFAWKIKDETFLRDVAFVSNLKLRLGYGVTGQQDGIANYSWLSVYNISQTSASYQFGGNYYQGYRPTAYNPNVRWEETETDNVGLDYGFWNNRIYGSIDVYQKKTNHILNVVPQPAGSNFSANLLVNVGDMTNKGVEFAINSRAIQNKDFTLDAGFNITYNKNTITNLTVIPNDPHYVGFPVGGIAGGIGGQSSQINAVGTPKNTFYLYKQVYDSKTGLPLEGIFADLNGDGIINQNDQYKGHSADPNVFLGFSTSATYKKWFAGFVLRASFGNYIYNNTYSSTGTQNQILGNSELYNASSNYLTTQFKGNGQELLSDYYLENGSFLRMDNFNVGYNVGKVYHNAASLRLSLTAQNVFIITKYKGLDPEVSGGVDNNLYPRPRIISVGANLSF